MFLAQKGNSYISLFSLIKAITLILATTKRTEKEISLEKLSDHTRPTIVGKHIEIIPRCLNDEIVTV